MPRLFDDHMIEDVITCIRATDLISEDMKARLINRIRGLRGPHCATVPSCAACPSVVRCEDRVGAILNSEADDATAPVHRTYLAVVNAA